MSGVERKNRFMENNISGDEDSIGRKIKELITFKTRWISKKN